VARQIVETDLRLAAAVQAPAVLHAPAGARHRRLHFEARPRPRDRTILVPRRRFRRAVLCKDVLTAGGVFRSKIYTADGEGQERGNDFFIGRAGPSLPFLPIPVP